MKVNEKGIGLLFGTLLFVGGGVYFYQKSLQGYALLCITVALVLAISAIISLVNNSNPTRVYESKVKEFLTTYDSILVKSSSVPQLEGRNIIYVDSMDDLVDAQLEIRKPICYLKQSESCSFVLLDDKEAYVYVEKMHAEDLSPVEIEIENLKVKNKSAEEMDSEMLRDIEKTTIVKLSNKKSYKVSPVRKKKPIMEEEIELI